MLYLLKIIDDYELRMGVLEIVVRASSESHARQLAYEQAEHEHGREEWLHPLGASCEVLDPNGPPEVVITYTAFA